MWETHFLMKIETEKNFVILSCAAIYNNLQKGGVVKDRYKYCLNCGKPLSNSSRKYCDNYCKNEYEYKQYIERLENKDWRMGLLVNMI